MYCSAAFVPDATEIIPVLCTHTPRGLPVPLFSLAQGFIFCPFPIQDATSFGASRLSGMIFCLIVRPLSVVMILSGFRNVTAIFSCLHSLFLGLLQESQIKLSHTRFNQRFLFVSAIVIAL